MKKQRIMTIMGTILALVGGFLLPALPAAAQGGIAISGSLSQQELEIPQGSSVGGPGVNVVVFNNGTEPLDVKMKTQAPPGVEVGLSEQEFTVTPGGNRQILVSIAVAMDAVPGEYEITVTAESYKEGVAGIQLAGAAQQGASLVITGESALVKLRAVSPGGEPLTAILRLYKIAGGQRQEVAYTEEGVLESVVAPGEYSVSCFIGGMEVAQESFTVSAGDTRDIELVASTVYFEGFSVVPVMDEATGTPSFMQVIYTVMNLYQRIESGEVFLQVSVDGVAREPVLLANLSPLEKGRVELNYNYIPTGGWVDGTWDFKLLLNLDGQPYTSSLSMQFVMGDSGGLNYLLIGGIAAAALVIIIVVFFVIRRYRSY